MQLPAARLCLLDHPHECTRSIVSTRTIGNIGRLAVSITLVKTLCVRNALRSQTRRGAPRQSPPTNRASASACSPTRSSTTTTRRVASSTRCRSWRPSGRVPGAQMVGMVSGGLPLTGSWNRTSVDLPGRGRVERGGTTSIDAPCRPTICSSCAFRKHSCQLWIHYYPICFTFSRATCVRYFGRNLSTSHLQCPLPPAHWPL